MDVGLFLSPFVFLFFLQGIPGDQVDLRREIAFNLSLIYQASGAVEKARYLLNTHCIIWKCILVFTGSFSLEISTN